MKKSVFIIGPVRRADDAMRTKLEAYKTNLEDEGYEVHLPHLDTNQEVSIYEICLQNMKEILAADEIHIFFNPKSYDIHFHLGVTFALCALDDKKIIKVIENHEARALNSGQTKLFTKETFAQMLSQWESK